MAEYTPRAQELARELREKALRNLERSGKYVVNQRTGTYSRKDGAAKTPGKH
jgi:hypothetical protein